MQITKMTPSDLKAVTALATQLGYPNQQSEVEARFAAIQSQPGYAQFVAKNESNEVVGWIQINLEPMTLLVDARADVAALVVDEKHRGKNIGKALLAKAESWAKENNIPLIRVRSNVTRKDAHRFYAREGYEALKTSNIFTKQIT